MKLVFTYSHCCSVQWLLEVGLVLLAFGVQRNCFVVVVEGNPPVMTRSPTEAVRNLSI
jgi:hypothetical protein